MPRPEHESLAGIRVGLLEARMGAELAELVRRRGAVVRSAPAVHETPVDCTAVVAGWLDGLSAAVPHLFVFQTGVGATTLFQEAERQGRRSELLTALNNGTVICRGPKPVAALRRYGITATVPVAVPYTTAELLAAVEDLDLSKMAVTLVHYGERNEALSRILASRAATVTDLCLYEWHLPDDLQPLHDMVAAIVKHEVDAVVFTSQVQWQHLLQVASQSGVDRLLIDALNTKVVVAAIGPVCAAALRASGVEPRIVPANPKMAPLVTELASYFSVHTGGG